MNALADNIVRVLKKERSAVGVEKAVAMTVGYNNGCPNGVINVQSKVKLALEKDEAFRDPGWEKRVRDEVYPLLKSDGDRALFEQFAKLPLRQLCQKQRKGVFPDSKTATEAFRRPEYRPLLHYLHGYSVPSEYYVAREEKKKNNLHKRSINDTIAITRTQVEAILERARQEVMNPTNPWLTVVALLLLTGRRYACILASDNEPIFSEVEGKPYQYHVSHVSKGGQVPWDLPCLIEAKYIEPAVEYVRTTRWPVNHTHRLEVVPMTDGNGSRRHQTAAVQLSGDERLRSYSVIKSIYAQLVWEDRERNQLMGPGCNRSAYISAALGHESKEAKEHYDRVLIVEEKRKEMDSDDSDKENVSPKKQRVDSLVVIGFEPLAG